MTITAEAFASLTKRQQVAKIRAQALTFLDRFHGIVPDKLTFIHHGENTTFRVYHGTKQYLCRVHRPGYQSLSSIRSELAWLKALGEDTDLIVSRPVVVDGEAAFVVPSDIGDRVCVLFDWLHGRFSWTQFSKPHLEKLGSAVAQLHNHAFLWPRPKNFDRQMWDVGGLVGGNMGGSPAMVPTRYQNLLIDVVEKALERVQILTDRDDTFTLIHADLHHGNRLTTNDGQVAIIDFDDCGPGYLIYDMAVCLGFLKREKANYDELERAFLTGYRAHRELLSDDFDRLDDFRLIRSITIAMWILGRSDHPSFRMRAETMWPDIEKEWRAYLAD